MWTPSLETSRKPKSKHHYRYKHNKISDNDDTFQTLTLALKHLQLKDNLLFHLNFQFVEIYAADSEIILKNQNSDSGSSRIDP